MSLTDELVSIIYNSPERCEIKSETFTISNAVFDISSGFMFFKPKTYQGRYPKEAFTFWERRRIWKAYKWWLKNAPVKAFDI